MMDETVRTITGCLKPTSLSKLYSIAGIASTDIRHQVTVDIERRKQENDPMILATTQEIQTPPSARKVELWKLKVPQSEFDLREEMSGDAHPPFPTWNCLNRLTPGVARCAHNMVKWGWREDEVTSRACRHTSASTQNIKPHVHTWIRSTQTRRQFR